MKDAMVIVGKGDKAEGDQIRTKLRDQITKVLGRNLPPDRFLALALREISNNDKLMKCSAISVCAAIVESAILGLEISSVTGQAYLVPFKDKCQLIVGYKGLMLMAWREGKIMTYADLIYENDRYAVIKGSDPKIIHEPALNGERGKLVGAYAVFTYPDGRTLQEFMDYNDLEKRRLRSRAKDNGPWITDREAMYKKCAIRSGAKFIPFDSAPELVTTASRDELREGGIGGYIEPEAGQAAAEITGEDISTLDPPEQEEHEAPAKGTEAVKQRLAASNDRLVNDGEIEQMHAKLAELGWKAPEFFSQLKKKFNAESTALLKKSQLPAVMQLIESGS